MQPDPHRPIFHFCSPGSHAIPFDPNGAIYWKGKYHLGYIYQKHPSETSAVEQKNVWGHIVSTDLLHWTRYPDMLGVADGEMEKGIYSGGAFLSKEGIPHIIYHGLNGEVDNVNLMAYSTDPELKVWNKLQDKGALQSLEGAQSFDTSAKYTVFDPDAWYDKKADVYYQITGGMKPAVFKSKDLTGWDYCGDLVDPDNTLRDSNEDLSCPDLFPLGNGKSMLLFISHNWGAQYYIGTFAEEKFAIEQHGRMNWPGGSFFAAEQLQDDQGRNIIWGWVIERKPEHLPDYGWSGIMSLPRIVSLSDKGELCITPAEEMKTIRTKALKEDSFILPANTERTLTTSGQSIELKLDLSGAKKSVTGVKVFASPDGREETVITYDPELKQLRVDFSKSSIKGPVEIPSSVVGDEHREVIAYPEKVSVQKAPLVLDDNEPLKLDIFLDRSVIEIFANDRQVVTQVVYPELETSTGIKVFSTEEDIRVENIQSWQMAQTNAD